MQWNKEQKLAIDTLNNNIIVSAGAGSGKTAVLTERIVNHIRRGVDIKNLLVLTFTNAAAKEMKERVRKKLSEDKDLSIYADLVEASNITTFDSYILNIVKKYNYLLKVPRDIKITDSYYVNVKINEILDNLLLLYYQNNKIDDYFSLFPSNSDKTLKEGIIDLYNKVILKPDSRVFLENYIEKFYSGENIEGIISKYYEVILSKIKAKSSLMSELREIVFEIRESVSAEFGETSDKIEYIDIAQEWCENYFRVISDDKFDYAAVKDVICNVPVFGNRKFGDADELKKLFSDKKKDIFKAEKELVMFENKSEIIESINSERKINALVCDITLKLLDEVSRFKCENNCYEFIDISKMAISLVRDFSSVREELKNNIYEILIDEYQDNSDLQEIFIGYISNKNVYTVGDIKQSIYRFRNANPYNFKEKYDLYRDTSEGIKIDLNQNYRSRREVLNNINLIFNNLMSDLYGDANYKEEHQMQYGFKKYDEFNLHDYDMEIVRYTSPKNLEDDMSVFSCAEFECFYIVNDIKEKIKSKYQVFDKETGKMRDAEYSDFAILIDRTTNFDMYKSILEYHGIPVAINADSSIKVKDISMIISSLIKLLVLQKNRCYDKSYYHSFMSIGRSFLSDYTDEELFVIIHNSKKEGKYFTKPFDNKITNLIEDVIPYIDIYSTLDVYNMLISKFEVIERLSLIGDVNENMAIIEYLGNFIETMASNGEPIDVISKYIDDLFKLDEDIKYSTDTKDAPGIKLMTIHKSKGLEFPICYFSMLNSRWVQAEYNKKIGYFEESGIYCENGKSVVKEVGKSLSIKKEISEKIRLFYVALTRAREKMIILSCEADAKKDYENVESFNSMNDFVHHVNKHIEKYIKDIGDLNLSKDYNRNILNFTIKYQEKKEYPKYNYLTEKVNKNRISKDVVEVLGEEELENIEFGLTLHAYLEALDFRNIDISFIKNKQHYDIINNVLKNDIFKNISKAKTYHEHEFIMTVDGKKYNGIIDLLAIYDDHIDIIDYKLSNVSHKEYDRQLIIYKQYVMSKYDLPINCYLLSLLHNKVREVK